MEKVKNAWSLFARQVHGEYWEAPSGRWIFKTMDPRVRIQNGGLQIDVDYWLYGDEKDWSVTRATVNAPHRSGRPIHGRISPRGHLPRLWRKLRPTTDLYVCPAFSRDFRVQTNDADFFHKLLTEPGIVEKIRCSTRGPGAGLDVKLQSTRTGERLLTLKAEQGRSDGKPLDEPIELMQLYQLTLATLSALTRMGYIKWSGGDT